MKVSKSGYSGVRKLLVVFILGCIGLLPVSALAQDSEAPAEGMPKAIYLPLKPSFIVNYGGKGRLRYIKTDVSVRVASADVANSIRHHLPFVRNNLVMLFAAQTDESISSQAGKEQLRKDALEAVRGVLVAEEGSEPDQVVDLFFNNFIVQK